MQSPYASIQSSPFEPVLFDASKCKYFQDIQYGEFVCNFGDETPSFWGDGSCAVWLLFSNDSNTSSTSCLLRT